MDAHEQSSDVKNKSLSAEDIVIIIAFIVTLILSVICAGLWFYTKPIVIPPPIISIFFGYCCFLFSL